MPSYLTRHVFRRLLANEPIVHAGCLRRRTHTTISTHRLSALRHGLVKSRRAVQWRQTRSIFDLNVFGQRRETREADVDPGIEEMMALTRRQRMRARLPAREEIAEAFKQLVSAKKLQSQPLQDTQAQLALQSLEYILSSEAKEDTRQHSDSSLLDDEDFSLAAAVLQLTINNVSTAHVELARTLFEVLPPSTSATVSEDVLHAHVAMLCRSGSSADARNILQHRDQRNPAEKPFSTTGPAQSSSDILSDKIAAAWLTVLQGFTREGNETEVYRTLDIIKERQRSPAQDKNIARQMLNFYTTTQNAAGMKKAWTDYYRQVFLPVGGVFQASAEALGQDVHNLFKWCISNEFLQFGHEVVRDIMKHNPPKAVWDSIFAWAANTGKSADDINRMIGVMEKLNETIRDPVEWRVPDCATVNALVEVAVAKSDPYLAERFISVGRERSIEPNAKTFMLQMNYRLRINDIDGALIAYKNLQHLDTSTNEDLPAVNQLIAALCKGKRHDFNTIMSVAADLTDRRARFEPQTVSSLTLLHLNRGEKEDAIDLLNTHAFHFSSADRDEIRNAIMGFIFNAETTTRRAWDAYTLIRSTFDETPCAQRTELMSAFFERGRPDMASNIFLNMRQHSREANMPTVETYVTAFSDIAKLRDQESLDVIHNQLKLDVNVNATTQLYNSLMMAYTACGRAGLALTFWDEIVASREGPTYNSLHIVLRACESASFGDTRAQEIWALLRRRGVELENGLWASYAAALAGNGDNALAIGTLEEAFDKGEVEITVFLLASLYMAAPGARKQKEIASWATGKFPGLWSEVEKLGFQDVSKRHTAKKVIGIDRSVTP